MPLPACLLMFCRKKKHSKRRTHSQSRSRSRSRCVPVVKQFIQFPRHAVYETCLLTTASNVRPSVLPMATGTMDHVPCSVGLSVACRPSLECHLGWVHYVCLCLCPVGVTVRREGALSPRRNAGKDEAARARPTKREVDPAPLTKGGVAHVHHTGGGVDPALPIKGGVDPALHTGGGVGLGLPIKGGVARVHHTGGGVGPALREDPAGPTHLTRNEAVLHTGSGMASATSGDTRLDETSPPPRNAIHLLLGKLLAVTRYSFLLETMVSCMMWPECNIEI